jgi:hypothetical protein
MRPISWDHSQLRRDLLSGSPGLANQQSQPGTCSLEWYLLPLPSLGLYPDRSMAAALAENTMPQWPGCRVQAASPHRLLKLIARAASARPDGWLELKEREHAHE